MRKSIVLMWISVALVLSMFTQIKSVHAVSCHKTGKIPYKDDGKIWESDER
jgi:hypothetical protein